jgi:hypothetical protein
MDAWYAGFSATVARDGVKTEVVLSDDGSGGASDEPWDGIWVGESKGEPATSFELTLIGTNIDGVVTLFSGSVPSDGGTTSVALQVRSGVLSEEGEYGAATAVLVDSAWPYGIPDIREEFQVAAVFVLVAIVAGVAYLRFGGR